MLKNKKQFITKISLSKSFPVRGRCKHCKSTAKFSYIVSKKHNVGELRDILSFQTFQFQESLYNDFYIFEDPKSFKSVSYFSISKSFNNCSVKLFKNYMPCRVEFGLVFTCDCNLSRWMVPFTDNKATSNRIASKCHALKIIPWF